MQRWIFGIVLGLALVAGCWRFVEIGRDPDIVTQSSQDAWGDPAQYLYNARSHALFGDWRVSEGVTMYAAPGYTLLAALCLTTFGVAFSNTVMMAMLAGFVVIATTAIFAHAAARIDGDITPGYAAAAALVLLLGSYIMFAHQHVPNGDMEALAVSSLAALSLVQLQSTGDSRGMKFRGLAILGGFGIGMAPFIKLHNGIFAIAAVAAWLVSYPALDDTWRVRWRRATPWLAAGCAASAVVWAGWALWILRLGSQGDLTAQFVRLRVFSVLTTRPEATGYNPKGTFALFRYFQSNLMYRQPLEIILGTLGFFGCLSSRRKNWPLLFACIWALTGVVVMTVITPDPLRYRLIVWPAIVVLGAHFWARLANGLQDRWSSTSWMTVAGLGLVLGSIAVYLGTIKFLGPLSLLLQLPVFVAAAVAAYGIVVIVSRLSPSATATILALMFVIVSIPQWVAGERQVTHELREAEQRLDKYPDNYVLGGGWGVRLGFSSKRNAYFFWTPESTPKVDLFVEDPVYLKDIPLPWHEVERHKMRRLPLEIAFVRIDR